MIGIIGAMDVEIESIKKLMCNPTQQSFAHINFFSGKISGVDCVVAICGPGKVNAAICTQLMISNYRPKFIINTGIAGSAVPEIKIGDIVLANAVVQHDVDTSALGDAPGLISGINLIQLPCAQDANEKIKVIAKKLDEKLHIGIIATGDQFIADNKKLTDIRKTFNAVACEMESGSIGHVCFVNNVKFVALRIISDNANEESPIDYNKFKFIVAEKTTKLIEHLLLELCYENKKVANTP